MSLSHKGVESIYEKLKAKAFNFYKNKNYLQSLNYIAYSAKWAYRLNFKYVDCELEDLLKDISESCFPKTKVGTDRTSRFVLLETHGMDNRGLTQQYIRAFMSMGVEFLYISIDCIRSKCSDIIKELGGYDKAKILLFEKSELDFLRKTEQVLSELGAYNPTKIFLHLMPWDVVSLMVTYSLKGVTKYNINLTDHAFWLGASFIDYNLEFRAYGKTVSLEKRKLKENQLLYLPFYPILPKNEVCFQGFPLQTDNKTIIFTGGAYYKMFGNNDLFFKIVDSLLDLSENAVVLIAGGGDISRMNKKLSKLKNKGRVLLIGNRKDINEVFKACDIYLDTYPIRGGLMEQYASLNAKSILAYSDFQAFGDNQEMFLQNLGNGVCGYNDWNSFIEYAGKLLNDVYYRKEEGYRNEQLVPSVEAFNSNFSQLITTHINVYEWKKITIKYNKIKELYLEVENMHTHAATKELMRSLGLNTFIYFSQYTFYFLPQLMNLLIRKIGLK